MRSYTAAGQINDKAVMRRGATIKRAQISDNLDQNVEEEVKFNRKTFFMNEDEDDEEEEQELINPKFDVEKYDISDFKI